jgi:hypothetical protein
VSLYVSLFVSLEVSLEMSLEVSLDMALPVEIKDEFDAGLGKSWGWALLFWVTVFAPILVSWPAAPLTWVAVKPAAVTCAAAEVTEAGAGCKVYWIPPCWLTVGVVDEVNSLPRPVAMFITGWGLKMMFWILLKNWKKGEKNCYVKEISFKQMMLIAQDK